jgi:nitrite reductase/ring-hydroxylating ferredoxin subunit
MMRGRPENRVARFVEAILRNRRPRRMRATSEEAEAMRAAVTLRAGRPGADLPDPTFVDRLGRRLRGALSPEAEPPGLSRRRLLLTAGTAAVGAAAGVVGDRLTQGAGSREPTARRELVPAGATWQRVVAASAVPDGQAVRFSTGAVEGFVLNVGGRFRAMSAVCTHLGCILQLNGSGRLGCPCHRTAFAMDGSVVFHELPQPPPALPHLRCRLRDGHVEVFTA